jgi:hypothetical protein
LISSWIGLVKILFNYGINPKYIRDLQIYIDSKGFLRSLPGYFTTEAMLGLAVNIPQQALPAVFSLPSL